jgi:2-oxoglutarate dehydrogenase E1 component
MGFEYGYSLDYPEALVAWEAQFGDFVNAGQVIIDQFIASAEDKWRRLSGLVLLLPHGCEGQGPEHSSARLERFLTLAAEQNFQVASPSTPAQYYHILRRQVLRPWRKPLVLLTPKSLLRHPQVVSTLEEFSSGRFQRVIDDPREESSKPSRVLLCSGKVYYDLLKAREEQNRRDVARLCGWNNFIRCRKDLSVTRSPNIRTICRCTGSRKSRKTWELGLFGGGTTARAF